MYTGVTDSGKCQIGLSDIDTEGTFVWTWGPGQPDDYLGIEDCVESRSLGVWNDIPCYTSLTCYFCSTKVNTFGQIIGSTYSPLADNTVLHSNTTLYCITENKNTPQVIWSYVDVYGITTDLISTTNSSTGISTIQAYTTQPGYYSCEVTHNGGDSRIYTAVVTNPFSGSEIQNLSIENTSENSILISWDLFGPVLAYGNLITFSIYLRTPNYVLITTTKDLEIELALSLLPNVDYTIQVELHVPFTTETLSATSYYFLASTTKPSITTTSTPQTSSDTTTVMCNELLQNTNLLTPYPYVVMIGIMVIIILMVLTFLFLFTICCILKRRATKEDVQRIYDLIKAESKKQDDTYDLIGEDVQMQTLKQSTKGVFCNNPNYKI
eukprot:TRINITY_DN923_c0_g1_i13.p1 TRINITY_DN923_c0_g1~~TRINITY_DN923_c0_g1_i13.p1  ORF type:complete len:381 (-),score=40.72 TRINITY_DN923_c0_g1_i13:116-1258(-)